MRAQHQPRLPLRTCARLVVAGIGFRMLRSGITVVIQTVAIAFLVFMLAGALIDRSVMVSAAAQLAPYREAEAFLTRLSAPEPVGRILDTLRAPTPDQVAEFATWSRRDHDQVRAVSSELLGTGADEATPNARALAESIREGQADALRKLAETHAPDGPARWIAQAPNDLLAALTAAGFVVTQGQLEAWRPFAARAAAVVGITEAMQRPAFKQAIAQRADMPVSRTTPDTALSVLRRQADAAWMAEQLASLNIVGAPSPETLLDTAEHTRTSRRLRAALDAGAAASGGATSGGRLAGLPVRAVLLIGLSLMVCVVGIANAMFMSVTERFGEIATMKCLGALNGSVMWMYLIEAVILGTLGGAAGALLGLLLAAGNGLLEHGRLVIAAAGALGGLFAAAAIAWAVGVLLSVVAAIVPSLWASRLAPMAAMRVE